MKSPTMEIEVTVDPVALEAAIRHVMEANARLVASGGGYIAVWRFEDAPKAFQALSTNGGDEDWIAFIPDGFPGGVPYWMGDSADRGWCNIADWYDVEGGRVVIGSHA